MSIKYKLSQYVLRAFILGFLVLSPNLLKAQKRALSTLLGENPDARTIAMGGVSLMSTDRNYLYVNPSSIFYNSDEYSVSINGSLFPKKEDISGRLLYGNATAAWQFADKHAAFIGYRYLGGEKIPTVTDQYGTPGNEIKPIDWTIDLGYSFKINDKIAAFATGSFIQSKIDKTASTVSFGLGGNFRTDINLGSMQSQLNIAARVLDIGAPIKYTTKEYDLPTSAQASADISMPLSDSNQLNVALGSRYFFLPTNATLLTVGGGAEYIYNNLLSARLGYNYGDNDTSRFSFGLGVNVEFLYLDAAYSVASDKDYNMFHIGLTASF